MSVFKNIVRKWKKNFFFGKLRKNCSENRENKIKNLKTFKTVEKNSRKVSVSYEGFATRKLQKTRGVSKTQNLLLEIFKKVSKIMPI